MENAIQFILCFGYLGLGFVRGIRARAKLCRSYDSKIGQTPISNGGWNDMDAVSDAPCRTP